MARLQILELPSGINDERPPFLLVLDQVNPDDIEAICAAERTTAELIGARAIFSFAETVEIPANSAVSPASDRTMHSEGAEPQDADARSTGSDCGPGCCVDNDSFAPTTCAFCGSRERCINHPGEAALAQGAPGHPFSPSGPTPDDAERAGITQIVYAHERTRLDLCSALLVSGDTPWRKLIEHVTERQRELAGLYRKLDAAAPDDPAARKPALTDALGMDRLRDWDDIVNAARGIRKERNALAHRLEQVQQEPTEPDVMDANQERPDIWLHGYKCGVLAAKGALRPRNEPTEQP